MAGEGVVETGYQHVLVQYVQQHVIEVRLNRPDKRNAMNVQLWKEIGHCFSQVIPSQESCRCVLLTGAGKIFSAGIDLAGAQTALGVSVPATVEGSSHPKRDVARKAVNMMREGSSWQRAWRAISLCAKPVIACIHGGCYGAALEMVAFADVRFCTEDAVFQAPEVDLGLAADIGGNQQLPKIIGNDSLLRELQLSGRRLLAREALSFGLVSRVLPDHEDLMKNASELAATIASKSPIATMGVKTMLNYTRDHSVDDALNFAMVWNSSMMQTEDTAAAGAAFAMKKMAVFNDAPPLVEMSKL